MRTPEVCIMGLGYVGLTLAGALLLRGVRVHGIEREQAVADKLMLGEIHLLEPGLEEVIREHAGGAFRVSRQLPEYVAIIIVCVNTPFQTNGSGLDNLQAAIKELNGRIDSDSLVIIRSTVPVGTTRTKILPIIESFSCRPHVVFAPERTIQGRALEELFRLPQIVGADQEQSCEQAVRLFDRLGVSSITVGNFETAELAKLLCNAYTDLRYSFGNEAAQIANVFCLDIHEVLEAANLNYPRPPIPSPGFVGGSCLTKDPYHLVASCKEKGFMPALVASARQTNERLPAYIMKDIETKMARMNCSWKESRVLLSGVAYKGVPETDDVRGSAIWTLRELLRERGCKQIRYHDFVVSPDRLSSLGLDPVSLDEGVQNSDIVIVLNNHPSYRMDVHRTIFKSIHENGILFDVWGVLREGWSDLNEKMKHYGGLGYGG